jgi:predicted MFS family arabinose efflux permease
MSSTVAGEVPDVESRRRPGGALLAVSLALFCVQLDFFALSLALPTMAADFHVSARSVQWTVSAYMLLVRRGLMAPLSMKATWSPPE